MAIAEAAVTAASPAAAAGDSEKAFGEQSWRRLRGGVRRGSWRRRRWRKNVRRAAMAAARRPSRRRGGRAPMGGVRRVAAALRGGCAARLATPGTAARLAAATGTVAAAPLCARRPGRPVSSPSVQSGRARVVGSVGTGRAYAPLRVPAAAAGAAAAVRVPACPAAAAAARPAARCSSWRRRRSRRPCARARLARRCRRRPSRRPVLVLAPLPCRVCHFLLHFVLKKNKSACFCCAFFYTSAPCVSFFCIFGASGAFHVRFPLAALPRRRPVPHRPAFVHYCYMSNLMLHYYER